MKTMKSICGMLAVLACTACSNNSDDAGSGNDNHFWDVTLQASMGSATNRALGEGTGNAIIASFAKDDEVVVVDADGKTVGTLKAKTAGEDTTLEGTLDASTLGVGEEVSLYYLSQTANYDGQKGTLADISSYAKGTLTVSSKDPLTFTTNSVSLAPQQSITKFSFTSGGSNVSVRTFGIAAPGLVQYDVDGETVGAVTGTLATASNEVYVALRNTSTTQQTYSFYIQDDAGNWYKGTKNATLTNGKNYTASVTLMKLPTLSSSEEGSVGVIGGLPAIVVDLGGTIGKKAVALMNTGALCPEHYGKYYTFANQSSELKDYWVVPTQAELKALAGKTNAWVTQNGVDGGLFTIGSEKLFLPAAGFYDNNSTPTLLNDTWGYYWSSTSTTTEGYAYSLQFNGVITTLSLNSSEKTDGLSVRPFHSLP
jgi:hypothetical protein